MKGNVVFTAGSGSSRLSAYVSFAELASELSQISAVISVSMMSSILIRVMAKARKHPSCYTLEAFVR